MRAIVLFFLLSGIISGCNNNDSDLTKGNHTPQVVTTIKPIQAIVAAIATDHVNTQQLIPDYASPHNYSFKPSDIRKVKNADLIFRIDKHMEVMLNPVFESLDKKAKLITLAEAKNIKLLPLNDIHNHGVKDQDEEHHQQSDLHIWTSPYNAKVMAKAIAQSLRKIDPENANAYQKNLDIFITSLDTEMIKIEEALKGIQSSPYIVFHNSWQYYAEYFSLKQPAVVSLNEALSPGARTLNNIKNRITSEDIGCIFTNPNVSPAKIKVLTENQNINVYEIDVLARNVSVNKQTYIGWFKEMGEKVVACLQD